MLVALCVSFVLCLVLIPLVRVLAHRLNLVDRPDGRRKLHSRIIPVAGGPAILLAACLGLVVALQYSDALRAQAASQSHYLFGLLAAGVLICALGVADDFGVLRGRHKLLGQIVAVSIVIASGVQIRTVHLLGAEIDLSVMALPFTAFILLGAINSLNLIDGLDGMLGSVGCIICLALGAMAWVIGRDVTACVALTLAGALLGFLCFNFPPASIFLGDSGSMLIGLTVGVLAIHSSLKAPATVALATPVALLAIPIFDTTAAILRRKLTARSIYSTDRGHIHHCLLRRLSHPRYVLLVVSVCCLLVAIGALAGLFFQNELIALGTAVMVVALLIATRLFGYSELMLVKSKLVRFVLSFLTKRGQGRFRRMDVHLHGTHNWRALLDKVSHHAFDLNLQTVFLDVSVPALHEEYHARWDRFEEEVEDCLWRTEIPLVLEGRTMGRLIVTGYIDSEPVWAKVAAISEMIESFAKTSNLFEPRGENAPGSLDSPSRKLPVVVLVADGHDSRKVQLQRGN